MMTWLRNLSLSIKINAIMVGALILLTVVVANVTVTGTTTLTDGLNQVRLEQEALLLSQHFLAEQEALNATADVFKNTPGLVAAVVSNDREAIRVLSLSAVSSLQIDDFDVFDIQGNRLIDTEATFADLADDEGEEDAIVAQTLLGIQRTTLIEEARDGERSLSLISARPLRDNAGNLVGGFLFAQVINDEFLSRLDFERDGIEISLIVDNQVVAQSLTNSAVEGADAEPLVFSDPPQFIASALSGTVVIDRAISYSTSGIAHSVAYIPVQGVDDRVPSAVMAVRINRQSAIAFQQNLRSVTSITLITLVISIIVLVIIFVRFTITKRIAAVQQAASNLAQGDYTQQITVVGQDEIDRLGQSFNQMAREIQRRQTELQALNDSLEQRVSDRTAQLKAARDEALAAQRIAQENSRLKSEFLSTMSHELRTPLNAIEGFTSIMLSGMGIDLSPRAEDMVKRVSANSQRLLQLINDFLDLSRIEAGRLELVKSPLSPQDLAEKWRREVGVLADKKGLEFIVTVDPTLPPTLLGDEDALSKIAINLLGNAFKFTAQGRVRLSMQRAGDEWAIIVGDTGIGIPPHAREYIFDEFRQVDGSSKRAYGGTGLGLSLVQKLSRAMGGNVTLQSEIGEGSIFTVTLPLVVEVTPQGAIP